MILRLSWTFFDKVALFLTVVAIFLCIVGDNMTVLLATETLDLAHILTFPFSRKLHRLLDSGWNLART